MLFRSECPLADIQRFHFLGMGHSWIAEVGDPRTAEGWQKVQQYSPLHRITPTSERRYPYPKALFLTSSNDDRTHPAHGRKMVHKMNDLVGEGHTDYMSGGNQGALLFEESEGGHGGNADLTQMARERAMIFYFFWQQLAPEQLADVEKPREIGRVSEHK